MSRSRSCCPRGARVVEGLNPALVRIGGGQTVELEWEIECGHWGAYSLGEVAIRSRDALGLFVYEQRVGDRRPLKVYPSAERLRSVPDRSRRSRLQGTRSRERGDGIEFADIRPFVHGDRLRRVNWRATARGRASSGSTTCIRSGTPTSSSSSTRSSRHGARMPAPSTSPRAAATLAERYLAHRDRVGLVVFGGILNWLTPATGIVQRYRIVDALLDAEILLSYAWKDIDVVPRRTPCRRRSSSPCRPSSTSAPWRRSPTCAGAASTSP